MNELLLIERAYQAQKRSYSPYSNFCVGAALLTTDGKIYEGCNIENAGYTPTNCAERTAFFTAVCAGERDFEAIAIVGNARDAKAEEGALCAPCGVCRQVMNEFCDGKTFKIILASSLTNYKVFTLEELFPMGFGPKDLSK